jgi:hypothetical protein
VGHLVVAGLRSRETGMGAIDLWPSPGHRDRREQDAGAFKGFSIRENQKFRIQTQIRNFPNHANLGVPEGNLNSGNYGRITSLNGSTTAGIVVVGARFIF